MKLKRTIIIVILLVSISGCSKHKKTSEIKTLDKAPDSLGDVYDEIGKILDNVGIIEKINLDVYVKEEDGSKQKGVQEQQDSSSTEPGKGASDDSNKENSVSQDSIPQLEEPTNIGTAVVDKEEKRKQIWMDIDKSIEDIYLKWSYYEREGVQKGASGDRVVELKESINKLTKSIEEKNIVNIYDFGSKSILKLKPFYDLYKDDYRGEICELKYSIYQYYIKAINDDIEGAKGVLKSKEENINRIRTLMGDDDKSKNLDKISASIDTIGISLEDRSKKVFMLEKDTLIKNLESLE